MLLKNHLIEVFKKASLENNFLLKENIVLRWVHRFGIDSLDDLLIYSPLLKQNQYEKEQISLKDEVHEDEEISLIDEVHEEEQISLMDEVYEDEQISLIDEVHEKEQISLKDEVHEDEEISLIDEVHEEEQISLMDEVYEEKNKEQIRLELSSNSKNLEETKLESNDLETPLNNGVFSKNQDSDKIKKYSNTQELPLPYIKNLRKWINKDKKAS